ncbi:hypothetical protein GCM10027424_20970 [Psychrobacter pacificensis]|uniref:Uncharacterized protein n=1 Tax=Psychrobacter pacificensis TaxID=112002 RepID=A0ABQ5YXF0_9GAMM|nr:hypothetical protein PKHYL_33910 [Psychrobacter sp. KH172YL61]GLR29343.1 hypothetical protein GCM10007915_15810 [Psychrobacter pacificensis]
MSTIRDLFNHTHFTVTYYENPNYDIRSDNPDDTRPNSSTDDFSGLNPNLTELLG